MRKIGMSLDRIKLQFDDADQSTLANICRVAADKFGENAKLFRAMIDTKPEPESMMQIHGEGARRMAEQFDRQAAEALEFADIFAAVDFLPEMVMDAEEDENPFHPESPEGRAFAEGRADAQ